MKPLQRPVTINGIGTSTLTATSHGTIEGTITTDSRNVRLRLQDVWYVPNLNRNLLSIQQLLKEKMSSITFTSVSMSMMPSRGGKTVRVEMKDQRYQMKIVPLFKEECLVAGSENNLHNRYGHVSYQRLNASRNVWKNTAEHISPYVLDDFSSRIEAKTKRDVFQKSQTSAKSSDEIIHSNVLVMATPSCGGKKYAVTFTDDYSKYAWIYPISQTSDASPTFKIYVEMMERQYDIMVSMLHSDNGTRHLPLT
ncbi:hypothetical protein SeLEV6574_g06857 [Synchytrium endobioticum]|uniref:Integrase catalytic domain-containing protein n=1 Tax=Synchytrium endobioticum TaxID=286115 RepID=A0A507CJT3_9FUNG|nr:hypothetical protein SeLEV6574_g06857 [Synchytrium endobioticum]